MRALNQALWWKDAKGRLFVFVETDTRPDRRCPPGCHLPSGHWAGLGGTGTACPPCPSPAPPSCCPAAGSRAPPCSHCALWSDSAQKKKMQKPIHLLLSRWFPAARDHPLNKECRPWSLLVPVPPAHVHLTGSEHPSAGQRPGASRVWSAFSLCFSVGENPRHFLRKAKLKGLLF